MTYLSARDPLPKIGSRRWLYHGRYTNVPQANTTKITILEPNPGIKRVSNVLMADEAL